jgi:hypothetical protein
MTPLFIEASRLKNFSVISENLDNKLIEPTIINVQELFLYEILGKDLYAEICTQINAGSVSALNQTLLNDYLEPYLINKVISESVIDVTFKIRNKAIMTTSSENGQVVSTSELAQIQGKYNNIAEGYRSKIDEYLCENGSSYPLYCPKNHTTSIGGIYLGNSRYENRYKNKYPSKDNC